MPNLFIQNLKYIIEHKINVFIEGRKLGVGAWQLLKHDISKFSRFEFNQYAARFFDKKCKDCVHFVAEKHSCSKNLPLVANKCKAFGRDKNHKIEKNFEQAWQHHQRHNKHHWQYWTYSENNELVAKEMPLRYIIEMLADWNAMSRKFRGKNNIRKSSEEFFNNSKNTLLHPLTREIVMNYFATGIVEPLKK